MGLDRDELAARFAVETCGWSPEEKAEDVARKAVVFADALLSALTPTPPPRESGTGGKYEPKVGGVVFPKGGAECEADWRIVVGIDARADGSVYVNTKERDGKPNGADHYTDSEYLGYVYLRPATASERAAAGLPPAPAPVAERPTHIRLLTTCAGLFAGTERDVINWHGACPLIRGAVAYGDTYLRETDWEPCPPPPPADARGEAYKALLAYAECSAVWHYAGISNDLWVSTLKRHGWDPEVTPSAGEFVKELCKRALAAARATKEA